jgi:hypothetical protein
MGNGDAGLPITSIAELMKQLRISKLYWDDHQQLRTHSHIRIWFRGQADLTWDLAPGVYRSTFNVDSEEDRLSKERHLAQDFRTMAAGLVPEGKTDAELYFLMQHYKMPTRLLDWTTNPLASLLFAVSEHPDKNGALFAIDAYKIGPLQNAMWKQPLEKEEKDFKGIATSQHPAFQLAMKPIFGWSDITSLFPNFILPVRPNFIDSRINLQRGCFTFHPPGGSVLKYDRFQALKKFVIPLEAKITLREELAILGIDPFSIYGDLDHLSEHLKHAYKCNR